MKNPPGIKSVLYIETISKLFSCLLALAAMRPVAEAATITVTDTGDAIAVDGLVTLREAMTSANNNADVNADVVAAGAYGTDTINFNIAGTGVHTIAPFPALPTITDFHGTRIADIMTRSPRTIRPDRLAVEAVQIMEQFKVNQLLVVDADQRLIGALNMHDLFHAKVL